LVLFMMSLSRFFEPTVGPCYDDASRGLCNH